MGEPHSFGRLLRGYRIRAGMTQSELALRAGVSVRALRDIEHGRVRSPRAPSVRGFAAALGLPDQDRDLLLATVAATPAAPPEDGPPADRLRLGVLGPLTVHRGDRVLDVGSARLRCLLGLLAIQPGQVVSRDEIIDVLWGDRPPATCRELLHAYVGRLRGLLEPDRRRIETRVLWPVRGGYRLTLDDDQLDLLRFERLTSAAADAGDPNDTELLLDQALQCWRGPALADADPPLWGHPARVALGQRHLTAVLSFADIAIELGHHERTVPRLRAAAGLEPMHEGVHARLILALAGCGQQADALAVFTELRARLVDELGVEPGPEVQDAHLRVLRGSEGTPAGHPIVPAQLPPDVAGFTGRIRHLRTLHETLPRDPTDHPAAVVLTVIAGMAGVGKTALAVHWAHRVRDRFVDGQLYANLHGYSPTPPPPAVQLLAGFLRALGVPAERVPTDVDEATALYRSVLAGKRVLVLLDNARDPALVRPLLPAGPGCLALVTSRDRLAGLAVRDGARRLTLDVLDPAEARTLLTGLLGDHAKVDRPAVDDLARACGLLPLALRIAAANLVDQPHQRGIAGYVAELRASNPLAALAIDEEEQVAVRAAFDLSYSTLPADTQRLFRSLGRSPGSDVCVEAAAALAGTTPDGAARQLRRLAMANLVEPHAEERYALHDLLRLYAAERGEIEDSESDRAAVLRRLHEWYLSRVDAAAQLLYPEKSRLPLPLPAVGAQAAFDDHTRAVAWLESERSNLIAVVRHAADNGPRSTAWLLADSLRGYFFLRKDTVDWLTIAQAALAAATVEGDLRGQASAYLSLAAVRRYEGRPRQAIEEYERALGVARPAGWLEGQSTALGNLASTYWELGLLPEAVEHYDRAIELCRQAGWTAGVATALGNLGALYQQLGRLRQAADHYSQALAIYRTIGSRNGEAINLANLAEVHHALGSLDEAYDELGRALAIHREVGDRGAEAETLRLLAEVHRDRGDPAEAVEFAQASLALAREMGDRHIETNALATFGAVHERLAQYEQSADDHRQALRLARDIEATYPEALALLGLAAAHHHLGQLGRARAFADEALALTRRVGYRVLEGHALTTLAEIHGNLGQHKDAAEESEQAAAIYRETGYR
jgi:DNA-binding SARP family transcriptional activator/tetratricopeptide (TPR) repeat protein